MPTIKEMFYSIQGEGHSAGRAAVFCRFTGCNLWSGRQEDRGESCSGWCDTDFLGGEKLSEAEIRDRAERLFHGSGGKPLIVFTGGEPALQLTNTLLRQFKGWDIEIETNGTIPLPSEPCWVTVSPKEGSNWVVKYGGALKLVWPQPFNLPEIEALPFQEFYLQPKHDENIEQNMRECFELCLQRPIWKISLQLHKFIGVR